MGVLFLASIEDDVGYCQGRTPVSLHTNLGSSEENVAAVRDCEKEPASWTGQDKIFCNFSAGCAS